MRIVEPHRELEPVVLRIEKRTPIAAMCLIAATGVVLLAVGVLSEGDTRWQALSFSGLCVAGLIWSLVEWARVGDAGLEVRLDPSGIAIGGRHIPWEAVRTAQWSGSATAKGEVRKPGILLRVRDVEGYKAPRAGGESIDHLAFRVPANILLDAIVRFAHPHTVYVIAVDPEEPWPIGTP